MLPHLILNGIHLIHDSHPILSFDILIASTSAPIQIHICPHFTRASQPHLTPLGITITTASGRCLKRLLEMNLHLQPQEKGTRSLDRIEDQRTRFEHCHHHDPRVPAWADSALHRF